VNSEFRSFILYFLFDSSINHSINFIAMASQTTLFTVLGADPTPRATEETKATTETNSTPSAPPLPVEGPIGMIAENMAKIAMASRARILAERIKKQEEVYDPIFREQFFPLIRGAAEEGKRALDIHTPRPKTLKDANLGREFWEGFREYVEREYKYDALDQDWAVLRTEIDGKNCEYCRRTIRFRW
jgi:hypothetical protein